MVTRLLAIVFLLITFIGSKAQPYGNEWVSYSQKYYKIKVAKNGIYRLDSTTLAAAGIDLSTIDPHYFQLFNKGVQQKIYIEGETDNVFNSGDFLEFYGEKNDGSLDVLLYRNTSFLPNPYYSLINDTSVYFLTLGSSPGSRMQLETDQAFAAYLPAVDYFFKEEIHDFHTEYYAGETDNVGGTDARYTRSEGWFDGNTITLGSNNLYNGLVNTSAAYTGGPDAIIRTVAVGASKDAYLLSSGIADHHLKIEYGPGNNILADTTFLGYSPNIFIKSVPVSTLGSSYTDFRFSSIADPGFSSNRTAVSYINVKYPHLPDLENRSSFTFYLPDNLLAAKSYLNLSGFTSNGTAFLFDLSNGKRIEVVQTGPNYHVLVPNSSSEKKCFITSEGSIMDITSLEPVTASAQFTDYTAVGLDSAFVIVTHKSLMSAANDYKAHRSSFNGGMHQVLLADIDELYDQYAYGIVKSPLAVRGFADHLLDVLPTDPHNLFLLGKSVHLNLCRQNGVNYNSSLVPSFGYPSSDNLLTAGLNGTNVSPAIPTGRLSAKNNADVYLFLNKVQLFEADNTPQDWMKYVLHFGGGATLGEQLTFRHYLNNYKSIIEDVNFGGTVIKSFFKNSPAPITINSSDTLRDLINNGVSMLTFFGHASGTGFDQSIDDWSTYSPSPRFPFLLANSCYAGDFHAPGAGSSSETYTFLNNNGVIGYLGSVGLGVPYTLNYFSTEFYYQLARTNYNKSIGSTIQKTIQVLEPMAVLLSDSLLRQTCYEMNLQGDPGLKLHTFEKPDYRITNNDVYFDMTSDVDSFTVYAARTNIGMAVNDSMVNQLIRVLPNGDSARYLVHIKTPKFKDTIVFKVPFDFVNGVGLNKIIVSLDWFNTIDELNEGNNSTTVIDLIITGSDIVPVYPYEFAIVPKDTLTLRASTANPFAAVKTYKFQIDTTDLFNSPLLKDTLISSGGGIVSWKPSITLADRTVYYWRVSPDSIDTAGYNWRESSFQYIPGKRGWEQAHFFQFKNDEYQYVKFNRPQRRFDFVNDVIGLFASTGIAGYTAIENITYKFDNNVRSVYTCIEAPLSGFTFVAIHPSTGIPLVSSQVSPVPTPGVGTYGDYHCANASWDAIEFLDTDSTWQNTMATFINNLPNGFLVLGYSERHPNFGNYIPALNSAFQSIGAVNMNALPDSLPYIIWGVKGGAPGTATEIQGTSFSSVPTLTTSFSTNWSEGFIQSPVIGPAITWDSLSWDFHHIDGLSSKDSINIELRGIDTAGNEVPLAVFNSSTLDVTNLGSIVSAAVYPRIRLVAYMKDDSLHTPPQMERWQVIYTPVPEAAINAVAGYQFSNDTLQEGDNISIFLPIQNISEYAFTQDSLLVTYWIEDQERLNHPLPSKMKKKPFNPGELIIDSIRINTTDFRGNNALWVEVNPVGHPRSQPEQYHFNNIVRIPFRTNVDMINPLLDVTFDGVHILNNDIVSAKPNILISLKDENRFMALNDTNDFKVFIKTPSAAIAKRVYFGESMSFIPASLPDNSCRINYTPLLYEDGNYQLLVQAKDKSDNQSGAIDYKINFEVVNRSMITEVMNYPNPFSTATRFVFTLTGSEEPTSFKIQIMTITGKVVREIFQEELGPIHIGRNITEFAWDGRDEFGDQLANGVYLYHVITRINGSDIEKKETAADQFFKKGWGKMYLMR
ncbi:MAG TPA: C25 family cysteine peptidase [Bacteroidia bacterium]|jgi:hypothetical protein